MSLSNYHAIEKNLDAIEADALVRLVCVSHKARKISKNIWAEQVYQDYCTFNQSNDIKGFSCKGGNYFFQCLEGMKKSLLTLMVKIFADKRHKSVQVILSEPIPRCGFIEWHRCCLNLDDVSFADNFIASQLQQYLPFKPTDWPIWYTDYFIKTIQKYNNQDISYLPNQANQDIAYNPYGPRRRAQSNDPMTASTTSRLMAYITMAMSKQPLLVISILMVLIIVLMFLLA